MCRDAAYFGNPIFRALLDYVADVVADCQQLARTFRNLRRGITQFLQNLLQTSTSPSAQIGNYWLALPVTHQRFTEYLTTVKQAICQWWSIPSALRWMQGWGRIKRCASTQND